MAKGGTGVRLHVAPLNGIIGNGHSMHLPIDENYPWEEELS
jgi:hypothetical protein